MQIVRTIVWVLLLIALLIFSINNWNPVEVKIWEGLVLETKVPALVVIAFLLGLVPMWLMHRVSQWYYKRRLGSLESAAARAVIISRLIETHQAVRICKWQRTQERALDD